MDRLLSVEELAALLVVPPKTVLTWRSQGRGPRGCKVGRYVRFRVQDVERWLEEQADRPAMPVRPVRRDQLRAVARSGAP